ncbi:MAG: N-6 DNA methylase [Deltaproteobacteria bacterium]|nr:N-6 DNA methylase [Deltaproteobacteria bacterium]
MSRRSKEIFATIRTEGAILPADLLRRIADGDKGIEGLGAEDYHLSKGEKLSEAVNRSWSRLLGAWTAFRAAAETLPGADAGTTVTRERWLLPLFQELGYGRLLGSKAQEIGGKTYPVSHLWHRTPIHLVGNRVDLDHRTAGVAGAARTSPHGLVQELLNRSEDYLWGLVSNGFKLRILRDNASLTRQAYVEFDLETLMDGEAFADFALLWVLCHQSRVEAEKPEECWLERWSKAAQDEGARALDQLRGGVEKAITALGQGFLALPANSALRDALRSGALDKQDYYRELLRLVYRLIFLFVAEDRGLLLDPESGVSARERYLRFYSTRRLRDLAGRQRGSRHADLYEGVRVVGSKLGDPEGCPSLGLKPLGSFLWSEAATPHLGGQIANGYFLDALRALAYRLADGSLRPVDYKNLRSEELGSVYEALLELHPEVNVDAATFVLKTLGGHERKTSGSYYTADCLVQTCLDVALEPVIRQKLEEAVRLSKGRPEDVYRLLAEKALLSLRVCDPACGSGHFLIASGHRIAKHLAAVRTGDEEPAPEAYRQALRDVIGHCLYGVDINPMAVELCKVALWMEALEPGKPLSFLDSHVQCGNALIGATPALMAKGDPGRGLRGCRGGREGSGPPAPKTEQRRPPRSDDPLRRYGRGNAPLLRRAHLSGRARRVRAGRRHPGPAAEGGGLGAPDPLRRLPAAKVSRGRLVLRVLLAQARGRPGGRGGHPRSVAAPAARPRIRAPGNPRRGATAGPPSRLLPLAPGVPPGVPPQFRQGFAQRLGGRLRRVPRKPAVGHAEPGRKGVLFGI